MNELPISAEMRVSRVLRDYPTSFDVFMRHGCPDMRGGFFRVMASIMKVKWAARVHKIPVDVLVRDLNAVARDGTT